MFIQFTPTRQVTGGDGKLEVRLKDYQRPGDKPEGKQHKSLGGYTEDVLFRIERECQCQTVKLQLSTAELAVWREFNASCIAGEFFQFDAYGTEAAPVDPRNVQLKRGSFKEQRTNDGRYVFSFTTVEMVG
ncbi:hypothetical protein [Microbulbifer sp. SAOS-129_SWC]|uniref:hypothetical protein n=1 Tax=Microbulbifer sp. SAOS-129_SWC TaxID=3145235 RepID=UPI0032172FF9